MMIAEQFLYFTAKALRSTSVAHTAQMKAALKDKAVNDAQRTREAERVMSVLERYHLTIDGQRILDFGCADGALTIGYLNSGAAHVVGMDVDEGAVRRARELHRDERLTFLKSDVELLPVPDSSIDAVVSYDTFEHVSDPPAILKEMWRILKPGGWMLIGTWGWRHPFAPHLWAVMPVPWAHLLVSERTLIKACRRVYHARWYSPTRDDFDSTGRRLPDKYTEDSISLDYLNHYLIADFERLFRAGGFSCETHPVPFGSWYANWTRPLLRVQSLREFLSGYVWFILRKPSADSSVDDPQLS